MSAGDALPWCPDHHPGYPRRHDTHNGRLSCTQPGCAWEYRIPESQAPAATGDFSPRAWSPTADYYIAQGIDIRDVIEAFELNYNRGAVVKYMARAGRKPGNDALLDLLKAREHINREIARLQKARPAVAPSGRCATCGAADLCSTCRGRLEHYERVLKLPACLDPGRGAADCENPDHRQYRGGPA